MKLIADSGGTKVEWALVDAGKVVKQIFTSGINTLILTEEEISQYIDDELILQLGDLARNVTEVYFYGAGCVDDDVCRTVRRRRCRGSFRPARSRPRHFRTRKRHCLHTRHRGQLGVLQRNSHQGPYQPAGIHTRRRRERSRARTPSHRRRAQASSTSTTSPPQQYCVVSTKSLCPTDSWQA